MTGSGKSDWFLDWTFADDVALGAGGAIEPSVRITTDDANDPTETAFSMLLMSADDDNLFSGDGDIIPFEPDILNWVSPGRSSFLNMHRAAQTRILEILDEMGVVDTEGVKLSKTAVVDVTEVKAWSRDLTLNLIFKSLINAVDDVFTAKAKHYAGEAKTRQARAVLRLDFDGDGEIGTCENVSTLSMELTRR